MVADPGAVVTVLTVDAFTSPAFVILLGVMLGACTGSFAGVVIERRPKNLSWVTGVSRCACGRPLKPFENIPIIGWLRVRGVARCCSAQIPVWYLHLELIGAVWGAVVAGACMWAHPVVGVAVAAAGAVTVAVRSRPDPGNN